MYVISVMGVTLGFHRLLTHRSFATYKPVQYALAILGSMAVQGPVMNWVADHRKHHAHTDQEGDPHTPHGHGSGVKGAVIGLWYAHMGWLFERSGTSEHQRYCPRPLRGPRHAVHPQDVRALGGARDRDPGRASASRSRARGAARSRRRCGAARCAIFLGHHVTWSINSVCHFFGTRRFDVEDHSTNVFWLSALSMGESWHHNHHTFPRSAFHGLKSWEIDPTGWSSAACGASSWPGTWSRSRPSASRRS